MSEQISKIVIELNSFQEFTIYGNWLGYDDTRDRAGSFSAFQNNLTFLASEVESLKAKQEPFILIGDFNADLKRKRRFDKYLNTFLQDNELVACENLFEPSEINYTYKKGKTTAYIDHALCASHENQFISNYEIMNDPENASDHFPIKIQAEFAACNVVPYKPIQKRKKHNFKWTKEFKDLFNKYLSETIPTLKLDEYTSSLAINQEKIDLANNLLSSTLMKSARLAEKEIEQTQPGKIHFKKIFNKTCHLNKELYKLKIK